MSAPGTGSVTATAAPISTRHVFISFASEDLELARRVAERLERSGFRCWISERDIAPGASYPAAITSAVVASAALVLLLTESANASPHVVREIELAFNNRTPMLPVRMSGVQPSADLQYFLSTTQWFDAGATVDDADFSKVESRLEHLLRFGRGGGDTGDENWWRWWPVATGIAVLIAVIGAALFFTGAPPDAGPPADTASPAIPELAATPAPATPGGVTRSDPEVKVNPRDGQTYVWVAPGRFVMGCSEGDPDCADDERPTRAVEMTRGFWLARTETTRAQYAKAGSGQARPEGNGELPVAAVTWAAAKAYCARVGGRLPSEVEWEYAARAGTATRYYGTLADIAWFAGNAGDQTHPVGTKTPNALGLHDMLGNVSEWVRDRYYNAYDDTADPAVVEEPLAGNALGVARGGSWVSDAEGVRLSRRLEMYPDAEEPHIGFRCAADQL